MANSSFRLALTMLVLLGVTSLLVDIGAHELSSNFCQMVQEHKLPILSIGPFNSSHFFMAANTITTKHHLAYYLVHQGKFTPGNADSASNCSLNLKDAKTSLLALSFNSTVITKDVFIIRNSSMGMLVFTAIGNGPFSIWRGFTFHGTKEENGLIKGDPKTMRRLVDHPKFSSETANKFVILENSKLIETSIVGEIKHGNIRVTFKEAPIGMITLKGNIDGGFIFTNVLYALDNTAHKLYLYKLGSRTPVTYHGEVDFRDFLICGQSSGATDRQLRRIAHSGHNHLFIGIAVAALIVVVAALAVFGISFARKKRKARKVAMSKTEGKSKSKPGSSSGTSNCIKFKSSMQTNSKTRDIKSVK